MALDALAIALQGLGFGASQTSVQGLFEQQVQDEEIRRSTAGAMWTVGERVRKRRKRQEDEDVLLLS